MKTKKDSCHEVFLDYIYCKISKNIILGTETKLIRLFYWKNLTNNQSVTYLLTFVRYVGLGQSQFRQMVWMRLNMMLTANMDYFDFPKSMVHIKTINWNDSNLILCFTQLEDRIFEHFLEMRKCFRRIRSNILCCCCCWCCCCCCCCWCTCWCSLRIVLKLLIISAQLTPETGKKV